MKIQAPYRGSPQTAEHVAAQIAERYGQDETARYNPYENCFTYREWRRRGFQVRKGEHGFKSFTLIEKKDDNGKVVTKYPKSVVLFYQLQVEPINDNRP